MLNSVVAVHKAYDSTRLYREIRLRSSLLNKGQLRILPKERLHNRYNGVWNLSSDQVGDPHSFSVAWERIFRVIWVFSILRMSESFGMLNWTRTSMSASRTIKRKASRFVIPNSVSLWWSKRHPTYDSWSSESLCYEENLHSRVAIISWDFNFHRRRNFERSTRKSPPCTKGKRPQHQFA